MKVNETQETQEVLEQPEAPKGKKKATQSKKTPVNQKGEWVDVGNGFRIKQN